MIKPTFILSLMLISIAGFAQDKRIQLGFKNMFKPISSVLRTDPAFVGPTTTPTTVQKVAAWKPIVNLPAFKVVGSSRPDAVVDVFVLTSVGGGISRQWGTVDPTTGKFNCNVSWSPVTLLLTGSLTDSATPINLAPAMTVGFFNNVIMLGAGYDLGSIPSGRSRVFGLLSVGINISNN